MRDAVIGPSSLSSSDQTCSSPFLSFIFAHTNIPSDDQLILFVFIWLLIRTHIAQLSVVFALSPFFISVRGECKLYCPGGIGWSETSGEFLSDSLTLTGCGNVKFCRAILQVQTY